MGWGGGLLGINAVGETWHQLTTMHSPTFGNHEQKNNNKERVKDRRSINLSGRFTRSSVDRYTE